MCCRRAAVVQKAAKQMHIFSQRQVYCLFQKQRKTNRKKKSAKSAKTKTKPTKPNQNKTKRNTRNNQQIDILLSLLAGHYCHYHHYHYHCHCFHCGNKLPCGVSILSGHFRAFLNWNYHCGVFCKLCVWKGVVVVVMEGRREVEYHASKGLSLWGVLGEGEGKGAPTPMPCMLLPMSPPQELHTEWTGSHT